MNIFDNANIYINLGKGFDMDDQRDPEVCEKKFDEVMDTLEFLTKKHLLRILRMLIETDKPLRYQEINKKLKINTKTLSERLKDLENGGLVHRVSYDSIPPRVEYSVTSAVELLFPIFEAIENFEKTYVFPKLGHIAVDG